MPDKGEIKEKIIEIVLNESQNAQIEDEEDHQAVFSDIGVDSLDLMMVLLRVTEIYGLELKEEQSGEIENIEDIVTFVAIRLENAE